MSQREERAVVAPDSSEVVSGREAFLLAGAGSLWLRALRLPQDQFSLGCSVCIRP